MFFDLRLFALTQGVRLRILLATIIGLIGLPIGIVRLALQGVIIAGIIRGQPFEELLPIMLAVAVLVLVRAVVQFLKEEVANRSAGEMKILIRSILYRHVLALGPGPFDQRRTGDVLLS